VNDDELLRYGAAGQEKPGLLDCGPVGPYLVSGDEVGDVQQLDMRLDSMASVYRPAIPTMVFDCAKILSYLSECMTLLPGDIIGTGTLRA
jgi:2-keto-4-pentenoate hydratase/2-oxohepta-3-ene-1,7-dioic acid hydratase in catechol pathway